MKRIVILTTIILSVLWVCYPGATVRLVQSSRTYTGQSTDAKPTSGVPAGSVFTEVDTGIGYLYDGSSWNRVTAPVATALDVITTAGGGTAVATHAYTTVAVTCGMGGSSVSSTYTLQGKSATGGRWVNLNANGARLINWVASTADSSDGVTNKEIAAYDSLRVYAYSVSASDTLYVTYKFLNEYR